VQGYPVDVEVLTDGLLELPGAAPLRDLDPGPGLGLVQIGTWEEDEHHPGPVYLDLDPRRLRQGRLDALFRQVHWGVVGALPRVLRAWAAPGSQAHSASLETLWVQGHRSPAVAVQLFAYRSVRFGDLLSGLTPPEARRVLDEAVAVDPLSAALHYQRYRSVQRGYQQPDTARLATPLLDCHAWSRGAASAESVETVLGATATFQPAVYGDLAPLAADFSLDARRAAVDTVPDPERALRLAVDWAYDSRRTDAELDTLLRPLAARSAEPVWTRLCEFRA
jgi:hypothetical protein